jgi:hypothetical protein
VPLNSERFADLLSDEAFDFSAGEVGKKVFFRTGNLHVPVVQLQAFGNQKKGRRFFACGRLNLVSCVDYKTSAQAGAATCQRQAQAFWFVQFFIGST